MARLNIEARGLGQAGQPGGIVACVTDDTGVAVTDLQAGDFSLHAIAGGPLAVVGVRSPVPGIYVLQASRPAGSASAVIAVVIARRFDRGQCLAEAAW